MTWGPHNEYLTITSKGRVVLGLPAVRPARACDADLVTVRAVAA